MALSLLSRLRTATALGLVSASLFGCQLLGPSSIKTGRINYNEVIQNTNMEQTFINLLRVNNNEQTTFVDVTQISATVLGQGMLSGNIMNIGVSKTNGSTGLGLEYQESPTIQYQPLLGAALISQIATPISAVSLGNLSNSDWSVVSLLMMAVNRITPGYMDYSAAVNALTALDDYGALNITPAIIASNNTAATTPPGSRSPRATSQNPTAPAGKSSDTNKQIYQVLEVRFQPAHPYLYEGESPAGAENQIRALWQRLCLIYNTTENEDCLKNLILIFRTPDANIPLNESVPKSIHILRTRSAYGILKAVTEEPFVEFVDERRYAEIRNLTIQNILLNSEEVKNKCQGATFYTVLPKENNERAKLIEIINDSLNSTSTTKRLCLFTTSYYLNPNKRQEIENESKLLHSRRLILIIQTPYERPNSYISYFDRRKNMWYSIDVNDTISQRNFILLSQFLTIQASATPALPLTPTISVGSK